MPNIKNTIEDINFKKPIYSSLTALSFVGQKTEKSGKIRQIVSCICICGNVSNYVADSIIAGSPKSCGCLIPAPANKTHGLSRKHPLYHVWSGMKSRCYNTSCKKYKDYGARGISVCDEWLEFSVFYLWAKDKWRKGLILDRIDNDGNYYPSNCRFTDSLTSVNNRRTTIIINFNNKSLTIAEWSKLISISPATIWQRLKRNWKLEYVLSSTKFLKGVNYSHFINK